MSAIAMPSQDLKVSNKPNKHGERAVRLGDKKIGYIKPHRVPAQGSRTGEEWKKYWAENKQLYSGFDWFYEGGAAFFSRRSNDPLYPASTVKGAAMSVYAAWFDANQ